MPARPTTRPSERPSERPSAASSAARLRKQPVVVIGAGGVGRQLALQLVALGITKLTVIDPAPVQKRHVRSAGYLADDIGMPKVDAVGSLCHQTNPQLDFTGINDRVRPHHSLGDAVFCCIDSLPARKAIWRFAASSGFWADVRLDGETIQVLTVVDEPTRQAYTASLAVARQAKSITLPICLATIGASLAAGQFLRHLRGKPSRNVRLDLAGGLYAVAHGE